MLSRAATAKCDMLLTLLRVCVLITTRLAIIAPSLCDQIILAPIAAPLLAVHGARRGAGVGGSGGVGAGAGEGACIYSAFLAAGGGGGGLGGGLGGGDVVYIRDTGVLAGALSVQACAELLLALLTACPPHRALLAGLHR
ncbi:hypothetical protein B484DRAFT_403399, partial [Ochromonadaceae sp. CCMP2298]